MWSNLIKSRSYSYYSAKERYDSNACEYHNWNHILDCYGFLEETGVPYDRSLDYAILYHDSVYDDRPHKEKRSAEFMRIDGVDDEFAQELILKTIDHKFEVTDDWRVKAIIAADLSGFQNPVTYINNYLLIMEESCKLYKIPYKEFAENNKKFIYDLYHRSKRNLANDPDRYLFWLNVLEGMKNTQKLSEMFLID